MCVSPESLDIPDSNYINFHIPLFSQIPKNRKRKAKIFGLQNYQDLQYPADFSQASHRKDFKVSSPVSLWFNECENMLRTLRRSIWGMLCTWTSLKISLKIISRLLDGKSEYCTYNITGILACRRQNPVQQESVIGGNYQVHQFLTSARRPFKTWGVTKWWSLSLSQKKAVRTSAVIKE